MRFQISTQTLKTALDIVNHATASISTTPILENILIKVNYNNIVFVSNNLEMAIEHLVNENIKIELEWSFCIPSKIFTNYIYLLQDENVEIELLSDNSLEIKTKTSNIKIKWTNSWEFPLIPAIKENSSFNITSNIIKKAIEKTIFSASERWIRPTLAWIYLKVEGKKAVFASTDSYRLSEFKADLEEEISWEFEQIIPSKTSFELKSILQDKQNVKIISWENQIAFLVWNTKIYSRLLNWKFPDYNWFLPTWYNTKSIINRVDLMGGLKKINLLSKENRYSIKMSFSKETDILIETSQTQMWEAKVYLTSNMQWEEAIVWLNSEFLLEALNCIEATYIEISFESPLSPILIMWIDDETNKRKDDFKHIIMPLKIS